MSTPPYCPSCPTPALCEERKKCLIGQPKEQVYADLKIDHPPHYTNHPSGVECIQIAEHLNFCLGNAIKYIWRAGLKADAIEDLKKARWYVDREIARLSGARPCGTK